MIGLRLIRSSRLLIILLIVPNAWAESQNVKYELAFTPFLPVRTMMQNYQPMRTYLEARLQEPVTFVTAPDYKAYNQRLHQHEYPFVITAANSAYLAYAEDGYVPMLRPIIPTRPVLVVAVHSKLKNIKELRGATLVLPDSLSVVAMQGVHMLSEAGLRPGSDIKIKYTANHAAAVNYVVSGESLAAIVSDRALLQMPKITREAVRVLHTWDAGAVPGIVYLAAPHVPQARVDRLRKAILEYVRDNAAGRELMKSLGYDGLVAATSEDIKPLAPYGAQLKAAMDAAP